MSLTTRFFSQGARKLQSGFSQLAGLAKSHGPARPSAPARHAPAEGLNARQGRQEAATMAPRQAGRPEIHSAASGREHAAPPVRSGPGRPGPQVQPAWRGPVMAQPLSHDTVRPQGFAAPRQAPAAVHRPPPAAQAPETDPHAAPVPGGAPAQQVAEAVAHLQRQIRKSDRTLRDLFDVRDDAKTDGDHDRAVDAIRAIRQQREPVILMHNILSGADRGGARQMRMLRDFSGAPAAVDPGALRQPGQLRMHADSLQRNAAALRSAQAQFGPVHELAGRAETLRTALAQHDLPPAARRELQAVLRGFDHYQALDTLVRDSDRAIRRMGGPGLLDGSPTTAAARHQADEAARRAHQAAIDNGY